MCRLIESHFHRWIDYNGVVFSLELLVTGLSLGPRLNITAFFIDIQPRYVLKVSFNLSLNVLKKSF